MCGYVELENGEKPIEGLIQLSFEDLISDFNSKQTEQFYPAFGGDTQRKIAIIIREKGKLKKVYATWWYDCHLVNNHLQTGDKTTFNARNLDSLYWQHSLQKRRGIIFATGLGESKLEGKTTHRYYFKSDKVFCLGVLYRRFSNGEYCAAVITRDAHPVFTLYHHKAFPCFLPLDKTFINTWLDETISQDAKISNLLLHPKLYAELTVQRVKTFKDKVPFSTFNTQKLATDRYIS